MVELIQLLDGGKVLFVQSEFYPARFQRAKKVRQRVFVTKIAGETQQERLQQ